MKKKKEKKIRRWKKYTLYGKDARRRREKMKEIQEKSKNTNNEKKIEKIEITTYAAPVAYAPECSSNYPVPKKKTASVDFCHFVARLTDVVLILSHFILFQPVPHIIPSLLPLPFPLPPNNGLWRIFKKINTKSTLRNVKVDGSWDWKCLWATVKVDTTLEESRSIQTSRIQMTLVKLELSTIWVLLAASSSF